MTGKDQRSRQGRRGRRAGRDTEARPVLESEAATPEEVQCPQGQLPSSLEADIPLLVPDATPLPLAAPATAAPGAAAPALAADEGGRPDAGTRKGKQLDLGARKAAAPEAPARSPTHRLLTKVPTPVRSPKSADHTPQGAGAAPAAADRFGASAPRGPEPWGAVDVAQPAAAAGKGGYREWLQARGQQAMQRSLMQGGARQAPPLPLPPPPAPCGSPVAGVLSGLGVPAMAPHAQAPLPPWFGAAGLPGGPLGYAAPATPLGGQQSPMAFGSLTPQAPLAFGSLTPTVSAPTATFGLCSQLPPAPAACPVDTCPQGGATPVAGQPAQKECSQQELMAALMPGMPGGFSGLDKEQLAEQLREAAATCCYYD